MRRTKLSLPESWRADRRSVPYLYRLAVSLKRPCFLGFSCCRSLRRSWSLSALCQRTFVLLLSYLSGPSDGRRFEQADLGEDHRVAGWRRRGEVGTALGPAEDPLV